MRKPCFLALSILLALPVAAREHWGGHPPAVSSWTEAPLLLPVPGARDDRNVLSYRSQGLGGGVLEVYGPRPGRPPLLLPPGQEGRYEVRPLVAKEGNYHWLQLREERPGEVRVASTAAYFSNPGPSPAQLLQVSKSELELVPEPLPREHAQYRESEKWNFRVRFLGQPLAGARVTLETAAGTRSSATSDETGRVRVLLPRDMGGESGEASSHGRPRPGQFALSVTHQRGGVRYLTAFNGTYGPDPERRRDLALGAGFGLLGMVLATPLLRRPRRAAPAHSGASHG